MVANTNFIYIYIYEVWVKSYSLTKILSLNVTECGLLFESSMRSTHFIYWCCSAWISLVKNLVNSRYDIIICTFQPTLVYIYIYIYIVLLLIAWLSSILKTPNFPLTSWCTQALLLGVRKADMLLVFLSFDVYNIPVIHTMSLVRMVTWWQRWNS